MYMRPPTVDCAIGARLPDSRRPVLKPPLNLRRRPLGNLSPCVPLREIATKRVPLADSASPANRLHLEQELTEQTEIRFLCALLSNTPASGSGQKSLLGYTAA